MRSVLVVSKQLTETAKRCSYVLPTASFPLGALLLILVIAAWLLILPATASAFEDKQEQAIQKTLLESRQIVESMLMRVSQGLPVASESSQLKRSAQTIRANELLLEQRFAAQEEKARALGAAALARHSTMAETYGKALTEYLVLIDSLPADGAAPRTTLQNLHSLLSRIIPKKKRPIIGTLPYKHLNYPARQLDTAPAVTPAYLGGNKEPLPADTSATPEAPLSPEIVSVAESLNWQPTAIYEYVKTAVSTEWYWGCMKGAEETLRQKSGNDCDQATLLAALLRASGFPTRYIKGAIEFYPAITRAQNLLGVDDPAAAAQYLQKAGIPYRPVITGGKISNLQIEHIYVESQIPYANYRGVVIDEHGKTWLGLDSSIKTTDYQDNHAGDSYQQTAVAYELPGMRDAYLSLPFAPAPAGTQPATPLEFLQTRVNALLGSSQPGTTYPDLLETRTLPPHLMKILPNSMQFSLVKATHEYTSLPEDLKHKLRLVASDPEHVGENLLDITLDVMDVSNRRLVLRYDPETILDQEIIDAHGGLDNTPAYLVRLRPVLMLDGERLIVGRNGLPMGGEHELTIELLAPGSDLPVEKTSNTHVVGNLSVIAVAAQQAVSSTQHGNEIRSAEMLMFDSALRYIDRWNKAEDELSSLLHLATARPLPTVVVLGGVVDVSYLLDLPHGFAWKGLYLDANFRSIETVAGIGAKATAVSPAARAKTFMQLSALQGSILENRVFEDDFKVEAISTAKLFQLLNQPASPQIVTIDRSTIASVLPTLSIDENIKEDIVDSVNRNLTVRIPTAEITYHDWTGIGYSKEDPATGESGWMLAGMIAGGSTVDRLWQEQRYQQILSRPYSSSEGVGRQAGEDGRPVVLDMSPADGGTKVAVAGRITATFSEFVKNVTGTTVQLFDLGPITSPVMQPVVIPASVYTSPDETRMRAVLQPENTLAFGHRYRLIVSTAITDSSPNSAGACAANVPSLPEGCLLNLDKEYSATFETVLPAVSDAGDSHVVSVSGATLTANAADGTGVIELTVPEGALNGPALIKVSALTEAQLPAGNPIPPQARFLAAVNIESSTLVFKKELHLSVPVPAGMPADAVPFIAQPQVLTHADGTEENVYVIVDSAKVVDGRLMTASPPFDGVTYPGPFVYMFLPSPLTGAVVVNGYTYEEADGLGGYAPGTGEDNDKPVRYAVIRAPAAQNLISYSNTDGKYAMYGFSVATVCRNFPLTAINPYNMYSHTFSIFTCDVPYIVNRMNVRLATKAAEPPDTVQPTASMGITVVPGQENDPHLIADTVPVGTDLAVPISVIDEKMGTVKLTVGYTTEGGAASTSYTIIPDPVGVPVLYSPATSDHPARWKYTYQINFSSPIQGSLSAYFRPREAGTYTVSFDVIDDGGNKNSRSITIRAVASGAQADGVDGRPIIAQLVPDHQAKDIIISTPVIVTFSEPVQNVSQSTFQLLDLGAQGSLTETGVPVPASIYTSFNAGSMIATLQPLNNLSYGHRYQVVVTQGITDAKPNSEGRCAAELPPLPEGCRLPLDKEYRTTFDTKQPQTYPDSALFKGGRTVALYTDPATGRTYAYVAAANAGWYVIDVTNPAAPTVVSTHSFTTESMSWQDRGLAVDQERGVLAVAEWVFDLYGSNKGYVRFFDLTANPADPPRLAQQQLAEAASGVPDEVALAKNHAYVSTLMIGMQVVDIQAAQNNATSNGSSIVYVYRSLDEGYGQPWDVITYKGDKAILSTRSGHIILFDLTNPAVPQVMSTFKIATQPDCYGCGSPIAVAVDLAYTETACAAGSGNCGAKSGDVAIVQSVAAQNAFRIRTVDLTDPYNPSFMGVVRDAQGNEFVPQNYIAEIAVNAATKSAYLSDSTNVYIVDIKDPKNPLLLNIVPTPDGSQGLAELNGWLFMGSGLNGMKAMDLHSNTPTVKIDIEPTPIIAVDIFGHPKKAYTLNYSISPSAGYYVQSASFTLYRDSQAVANVPAVASGAGTFTIPTNAVMDPDAAYTIEVKVVPQPFWPGASPTTRRAPLTVMADSVHSVGLERAWHLSKFDEPVPGIPATAYTDSYETITFTLAEDAQVTVKVLDTNKTEKAVLVPAASLATGDHRFLVDYSQVQQAGFDPVAEPAFYVALDITSGSGGETARSLYPGRMYQRSDGKMLGQTIVHDVLIQDGSLNLSRQDLSLKGRGPQLAFSRSYNNQPSARGFKPLGEGWSHSLDMKLRMLGTQSGGPQPLWVSQHKGIFYTSTDEAPAMGPWAMVQANGTVFQKNNGTWYAERGHHGSLSETATAFVYTAKDGTRYTYPYPAGVESKVQKIEDRNGNALTFEYDTDGRLKTVRDAVNRTLTLTYEALPGSLYETRLKQVTGPDNIAVVFDYNPKGYLSSVTRGSRVEWYYYQQEPASFGTYNLVTAKDVNNHSYSYTYYQPNEIEPGPASIVPTLQAQDVVKTVTYPSPNADSPQPVAHFQYEMLTVNKRTVTDLRGHDTVYTLNYYGNPTKIEEPLGKVTLMTWSIDESLPDNVMTSRTDALLNKTTYQYDGTGNIMLETDPYGKSIETTWNQKFSLPEYRKDRNGVVQRWHYDPVNGNLDSHEDGDQKTTNYTYYTTGELKIATDPDGNKTTYTYDNYGNPASVAGDEGSTTVYEYDIRGRKRKVTDPNQKLTEYSYDNLDHPSQVIYPGISSYALPAGSSNSARYHYDPVGNLLDETNRNGLTLTYTYTPRNQVETVTRSAVSGGLGDFTGPKSYSYDENGNLLTETDWNGHEIKHTYNDLNQRDTTRNRLNDTMYMGYDLVGNLTSVTDYEGKITSYTYDNLYRQTDIYQPDLDGQQPHVVKTYYFEADPKTNLKTETDQEGNTTTYEYNRRYLPKTRTNALNGIYLWDYYDNGNLKSETDEEGNASTYDYDRQNRRTAMHRTVSGHDAKSEYKYDNNGNRAHLIDPIGHDTETKYDAWNRPWQVKDADGFTTTTEYDGEGNPVKVTDGNTKSRTWTRDVAGRVLTYTDGEARSTKYTYDQNGNVRIVEDARGSKTETDYDNEDRITTVIEAVNKPEKRVRAVTSRDKMGNPKTVHDFNGNVMTSEYNGLYLPTKVCDPAPFSSQCTETAYYKTGKVKSVQNRREKTTSYEYDALNREKKVTDPLSQTIVTTYNKVGKVKTVKDKRNIVTENFYDEMYRVKEVHRAGKRLVTNEYDDAGNKKATIDANNIRTEYAYWNRNLLKTTTFPDQTTEDRTYDGVGNLLTVKNEEQKITTYTYDGENRQTSAEFEGEKTEKGYDEVGNLVLIIKPKQNKRKMEYDYLKRLVKVVDDPDGLKLETRYVYDDNGNVRNQYVVDRHVEYVYDSLNRKTKHVQYKAKGNLETKYDYDAEGNLKSIVDAKGQTFTFTYDDLNRQADELLPNASTAYMTLTKVHTDYDGNNNVTGITETKKATDGSTITDTTTNEYDDFDRLTRNTQRGTLITYTYDDNGNRKSVSTDTGSTGYDYDNRNRLKTTTSQGGSTGYTYFPDGKKETITYANGTSTTYTYHPTNRIKTVVNKAADGSVISSYGYDYDPNGNRTSQIEVNGTTETTTYTYDTLDRMANFLVTGNTGSTKTEYTFEGYNRKTEKVMINGVVTANKTYTYDETDWLAKVQDSVSSRTVAYSYDNNGNTISKTDKQNPSENKAFEYDSLNRLVQAKGSTGSILGLYDYNSEGLRIRHRNSERGDVDYFYDGRSVIEEHASDTSFLARYQYGDRLIAMNALGGSQYYLQDGLGSTVNMTDTAGNGIVTYNLDPWGTIKNQTGYSFNTHIFTGKELDSNTGLTYFGARYYDSNTARFITQDIYLGERNNPPSLNRYLYTYHNPTVFVDKTGFEAESSDSNVDEQGGKSLPTANSTAPKLTAESANGRPQGEVKPIIVIDPGHGGRDPGKDYDIGPEDEEVLLTEKEIARKISKKLKDKLDSSGKYVAYSTRDLEHDDYVRDYNKDNLVGYETDKKDYRADTKKAKLKATNPEQRATLDDRAAFSNDKEASLFVSIHANASVKESVEGMWGIADTRISGKTKEETYKFRKILEEKLEARGYDTSNFEKKQDLWVIYKQKNRRPAIVLETGFITNEGDRARLQNSEYQSGIASAIKEAIDVYFNKK